MSVHSIIIQHAAVSDYLFLIIVVVASIIQSITQNRKKKALQELSHKDVKPNAGREVEVMGEQSETMKGYETPEDTIFGSIERMLIPEPDETKYEWSDDYAEAETIKTSSNENIEKAVQSAERSSPQSEVNGIAAVSQNLASDIPVIRHKSRIREGFSLRKAVIYSEILNRKYT